MSSLQFQLSDSLPQRMETRVIAVVFPPGSFWNLWPKVECPADPANSTGAPYPPSVWRRALGLSLAVYRSTICYDVQAPACMIEVSSMWSATQFKYGTEPWTVRVHTGGFSRARSASEFRIRPSSLEV